MLIGNYLPVAGFVFDFCGARATVTAAVLLNFVGYGTLWAIATGLLPQSMGLLLAACVLAGHGSGYFDAAGIVSITLNFPKTRGLATGLLKSFYGLSGAILTVFFIAFFNDNPLGFVFFLAVALSACGVVVIGFLNSVPAAAVAASSELGSEVKRRFQIGAGLVVLLGMYLSGTTLPSYPPRPPTHCWCVCVV